MLIVTMAFVTFVSLRAQSPTPVPLTPGQQAEFSAAKQDFAAQHWTDALAKMKKLHSEVPGNALITAATAETALNASDDAYAIALLKPVEDASPDDWRVRTFLARAYAETHQDALRDAEVTKLLAMHKATTDPQFKQLQQFQIERIALPAGHIDLYYSVEPWSQYKIYEMARVFNAEGQQTSRITLESGDFDQPLWAKQHPKEAAAGERMFSMDGYGQGPAGPDGRPTQTHATYGFFDGRPTYAVVKERMVDIASGKAKGPMSTTTGIPAPKQ